MGGGLLELCLKHGHGDFFLYGIYELYMNCTMCKSKLDIAKYICNDCNDYFASLYCAFPDSTLCLSTAYYYRPHNIEDIIFFYTTDTSCCDNTHCHTCVSCFDQIYEMTDFVLDKYLINDIKKIVKSYV